MSKIYLVLLGNSHDPGPIWIGPMGSMSSAQTLNDKMGGKGFIETTDMLGPLSTDRVISLHAYRKGLLS